jgi:site-specific DNA-methyltransferase (adenine-specific)
MVGSCLDRMRELPDASVDAVVTDPPYELGFMGKSWDSSGIAFNTDVWAECLRVLKPGGHLLAFGGSRTWHRIAVAVEDAGFQIRDSVAWLYGSGFPKSLDVSKAIDKAAGAEREVIGEKFSPDGIPYASRRVNSSGPSVGGNAYGDYGDAGHLETAPATQDAVKWQGWGTALKPAFEPVIVARKPLVGTVAANVLEFGTGALNIDGTRIDGKPRTTHKNGNFTGNSTSNAIFPRKNVQTNEPAGRWPSNVMLDEFTAGLVDEQSGVTSAKARVGGAQRTQNTHTLNGYGSDRSSAVMDYGDSGGASRFFFVADSQKHDKMTPCENTNARTVANLFTTIRATIESSARTNVEDLPNELNAQTVKNAAIQCDSCATHIAADLVALKILATNAETSTHFQAFIKDSGNSTLNLNLALLVEKWESTGIIPTTTDCLTLFGCALLAIDEPIRPESLKSDKGQSSFIYQAKASKRDRNEGLDALEEKQATMASDSNFHLNGDGSLRNKEATIKNFHPTVKPTDLMRQLVRLVTPPGGVVLDPFTGSGSTGKAAILEGFEFIGCELTEEYLPIIEGRLNHAVATVAGLQDAEEEKLF